MRAFPLILAGTGFLAALEYALTTYPLFAHIGAGAIGGSTYTLVRHLRGQPIQPWEPLGRTIVGAVLAGALLGPFPLTYASIATFVGYAATDLWDAVTTRALARLGLQAPPTLNLIGSYPSDDEIERAIRARIKRLPR